MYAAGRTPVSDPGRILVVRLGAMGDIIHTLPAAASLKHSFPRARLAWVVNPRWNPLLEGNPFVDEVISFQRTFSGIPALWRRLRSEKIHRVVDFQGLIQSALIAAAARADEVFGFHESQVRERPAALVYSRRIRVESAHVVDRNLELARAAGAKNVVRMFPLPEGAPEGDLPRDGFLLASPFAGWASKQWPLQYYERVGELCRKEFGLPLVLNSAPGDTRLDQVANVIPHYSSLAGLIYATRLARGVIGVDSGPLHLAAALGKPGVALFGPTSPERNGPYGNTFLCLRSSHAATSYKRRPVIDESMWQLSPESVVEKLRFQILVGQSARCQV